MCLGEFLLSTCFNQVYRLNTCRIITVSYIPKGELMIYVGIAIFKLNHFSSAISSDNEIVLQLFKFINDYNRFYLLVQRLDSDRLTIVFESTAHYGNSLVEILVNNHYKVCVINPIQTSALRKTTFAKPKRIKQTFR